MRSGKTLRDRRNKDHEKDHPENFYSTPEIFTEWLLENEEFEGLILEPACGDGRMAKVLKAEGYHVRCSDIVDRGYKPMLIRNFFDWKVVDNIVTNPPYDLAEEFVRHGVKTAVSSIPPASQFPRISGPLQAVQTTPTRSHICCLSTYQHDAGDLASQWQDESRKCSFLRLVRLGTRCHRYPHSMASSP